MRNIMFMQWLPFYFEVEAMSSESTEKLYISGIQQIKQKKRPLKGAFEPLDNYE